MLSVPRLDDDDDDDDDDDTAVDDDVNDNVAATAVMVDCENFISFRFSVVLSCVFLFL